MKTYQNSRNRDNILGLFPRCCKKYLFSSWFFYSSACFSHSNHSDHHIHFYILHIDILCIGVYWTISRHKPLLTKEKTKTHLTFAKNNISVIILLLKGVQKLTNSISQKDYGGGSVKVWGCFAAKGPGWLTIIESCTLPVKIEEDCHQFVISSTWIVQQHNDRKKSSMSTSE